MTAVPTPLRVRYVARECVYGWGVYDVALARWVRYRLRRERAKHLALELNQHARLLRVRPHP